jgi:hypothetical protein
VEVEVPEGLAPAPDLVEVVQAQVEEAKADVVVAQVAAAAAPEDEELAQAVEEAVARQAFVEDIAVDAAAQAQEVVFVYGDPDLRPEMVAVETADGVVVLAEVGIDGKTPVDLENAHPGAEWGVR